MNQKENRERFKGSGSCGGLDLRFICVAGKVLRIFSVCCGRETAEMRPVDDVKKPS